MTKYDEEFNQFENYYDNQRYKEKQELFEHLPEWFKVLRNFYFEYRKNKTK